MKRVSIVGFGSILGGDLGIGCYLVEALCQEPLAHTVELAYLGENLQHAGMYLFDRAFTILAGGLCLGGKGGEIHCWDRATFQHNASWLSEKSPSIGLLAQAMAHAELRSRPADDVLLVWIEPERTEGFGISPPVRKALRKTVRIIKEQLFRRGLIPETTYRLSSIYQLEALRITA